MFVIFCVCFKVKFNEIFIKKPINFLRNKGESRGNWVMKRRLKCTWHRWDWGSYQFPWFTKFSEWKPKRLASTQIGKDLESKTTTFFKKYYQNGSSLRDSPGQFKRHYSLDLTYGTPHGASSLLLSLRSNLVTGPSGSSSLSLNKFLFLY